MMKSPYGIENITPEFLSMIKLPSDTGKRLNYLIVIPTTLELRIGFPIGIAIISASLKASGRNVFTVNLQIKDQSDVESCLKHEILTNNIDVVMTGGTSRCYEDVKQVIDLAKEIKPSIITIVGGVIISADPEVSMEALSNADYGVIGEGEITVNALAFALENDKDASELAGVICKNTKSRGGGGTKNTYCA